MLKTCFIWQLHVTQSKTGFSKYIIHVYLRGVFLKKEEKNDTCMWDYLVFFFSYIQMSLWLMGKKITMKNVLKCKKPVGGKNIFINNALWQYTILYHVKLVRKDKKSKLNCIAISLSLLNTYPSTTKSNIWKIEKKRKSFFRATNSMVSYTMKVKVFLWSAHVYYNNPRKRNPSREDHLLLLLRWVVCIFAWQWLTTSAGVGVNHFVWANQLN